VEEGIRQFLTMVCGQLRQSPGSVEVIYTYGTSVLEEPSHHWIDFGVSNLMEIHTDVGSMIDMIKRFREYDDDLSLFMPELLGVMDDFAFHAAIFNVYFFSFEAAATGPLDKSARESRHRDTRAVSMDIYRENLDAIVGVWDLDISEDEKRSLLTYIVLECLSVMNCFDHLFVNPDAIRATDRHWHLRRLCKAIAALQFYWSVIRYA
jgi:hypothetical protein